MLPERAVHWGGLPTMQSLETCEFQGMGTWKHPLLGQGPMHRGLILGAPTQMAKML